MTNWLQHGITSYVLKKFQQIKAGKKNYILSQNISFDMGSLFSRNNIKKKEINIIESNDLCSASSIFIYLCGRSLYRHCYTHLQHRLFKGCKRKVSILLTRQINTKYRKVEIFVWLWVHCYRKKKIIWQWNNELFSKQYFSSLTFVVLKCVV